MPEKAPSGRVFSGENALPDLNELLGTPWGRNLWLPFLLLSNLQKNPGFKTGVLLAVFTQIWRIMEPEEEKIATHNQADAAMYRRRV